MGESLLDRIAVEPRSWFVPHAVGRDKPGDIEVVHGADMPAPVAVKVAEAAPTPTPTPTAALPASALPIPLLPVGSQASGVFSLPVDEIVHSPDQLIDFRRSGLTFSQKMFVLHLMRHGTPSDACRACRVSLNTVRKWLTESDEFRDAVSLATEAIGDRFEKEMMTVALRGDTRALHTLLRAYKRGRYGDKVEHVGPGGGPIRIETWQSLAQAVYDNEIKAKGGDSPQ